jgi:type III restriction enzyme
LSRPTLNGHAFALTFDLPRFEKHLLCDSDGTFPADFNSWEGKVVEAEMQREGSVAWYRNPDRASQDSLGVIYEDSDEMKIVRPDFVFFAKQADGIIVADIVDPHGIHLADALPKLKGLAKYAEANAGNYRRIEAVTKIDERYRMLDLTKDNVRAAINGASSAKVLYSNEVAKDYLA